MIEPVTVESSLRRSAAPVSVVIPCYRCRDTIERAVLSVVAQTWRPAELLLVDDASSDGTIEVLERLRAKYGEDWIQIIRLPFNEGPASARNAGWAAAVQRYVAFLDSDDSWHPRKIEIQCAWMESHPDIVVCGHASRQLRSGAGQPIDTGGGEGRSVTRPALFVSNRFITPSAMVRRDIPQRFEPAKRHMEDYLLWLEIAGSGQKIVRLPHVLAYTYKAPFGAGGLSAHAWEMEKGELAALITLRRKRFVGSGTLVLLTVFSVAKYLRRLAILSMSSNAIGSSGPSYVFPAAYLLLTQSMTALLVGVGLLGHRELAADIGIVQAATLATFFAFSGNARNLILTTRTRIPVGALLATRVILLVPLGMAAVALCVIIARVGTGLALALIARRAVEWIGELHLSERELAEDVRSARRNLAWQLALLVATLAVIAAAPDHMLWAILAWALLPLVLSFRFLLTGMQGSAGALLATSYLMLPHLGSTGVNGVAIYVFRALLVLVAGKAIAGDLFVAFAVGSFLGSIFANVLGPSVSLQEERSGAPYFPVALLMAVPVYLVVGVALLGASWMWPTAFGITRKSVFFWQAMGWSLLGGAVMLLAQRVRLRLIASGQGGEIFGADVLMNVCLMAAVPVLAAIGSKGALATLYLLNAALLVLFYATARRGFAARIKHGSENAVASVLAFCILFPFFVQLSGGVFNPVQPMWDSGGLLQNVPLPISLFACFAGLVLLGRFGDAMPSLWTILGLLVLMLLSTVVLASDSESAERAKFMLMVQVLLPMFGLVLGSICAFRREEKRAFLVVVSLVVPAQLLASWVEGTLSLTHSLWVFSVYQHRQYVPVMLASGFLVALPSAWQRASILWKTALTALFALVGAYAVAAVSVVAMAATVLGAVAFAALEFARRRAAGAILTAVVVITSMAGYSMLSLSTDAFWVKFGSLMSRDESPALVHWHSNSVRRDFSTWRIKSNGGSGEWLLQILPPVVGDAFTLQLEGELIRGGFGVTSEDTQGVHQPATIVERSGPFKIAFTVPSSSRNVIVYQYGIAAEASLRMRWVTSASKASDSRSEQAQEMAAKVRDDRLPIDPSTERKPIDAPQLKMANLAERVVDWRHFGSGIFESEKSFLLGHEKPLPREVRTSAHNFYIDLAYNFGVLTLVPLFALIAYTASQLWRHRRRVFSDESLLALAFVVGFLLFIECNLKVTLRQPYPGIATYFLWGILVSRLRSFDGREELRGPEKGD